MAGSFCLVKELPAFLIDRMTESAGLFRWLILITRIF